MVCEVVGATHQPCMEKTIATNAPLLFLVEYSDIIIADRGYIAPIPIPKKKRQNAREPIIAGPLVPKEYADMKANTTRIQHAISNKSLRPKRSARDPPITFPMTAPHNRTAIIAASYAMGNLPGATLSCMKEGRS